MQEVELKLVLDDTFREEELASRLAAVTAGEARTATQNDTYLDTPGGELAAAGLSARVREKGGARRIDVKPVPIDPALVQSRAELTAVLPKRRSPGGVLARLLDHELGLTIEPRAVEQLRLVTERRKQVLTAADWSAELCLDEATVFAGDEVKGGFRELELELVAGDEAAFRAFAETLADLPGARADGLSKYQRARRMAGLPDYRYGRGRPKLRARMSEAEAARHVCRRLYETMRAHEPGTVAGLDSEQLHKMRVASRRMRVALTVFRRAFRERNLKPLLESYKWLAAVLGEVRDLDVHLLAIPAWQSSLGRTPVEGWRALEERLLARRDKARRAMLRGLRSKRYERLCQRSEELFGDDSPTGEGSEARVGVRARALLTKRAKQFRKTAKACRKTGDPETLHELRKLGKKLRYTGEFFRAILGKAFKARLKDLSRFQDELGLFQDNVVAGELARELREEVLAGDRDPALLHVLGLLLGRAVTAGEFGREKAEAALEALDAPSLMAELTRLLAKSGAGKRKKTGKKTSKKKARKKS